MKPKLEKVKEADSNGEEPVLDIMKFMDLARQEDLAELAGDLSLRDRRSTENQRWKFSCCNLYAYVK